MEQSMSTRQPATTGSRVERPAGSTDGGAEATERFLHDLLAALTAAKAGESTRLSTRSTPGLAGEVVRAYNDLVDQNTRLSRELARVARVVGQEGRMTERVQPGPVSGTWATAVDAVNSLIDDLARPTNEVARVISAVAQGDLTEKMALAIEGRPMKGEFQRIGEVVNSMVDQLRAFADEVTRVAREVGTEGKLGGQANVKGVSGTWKDLTDNVNQLAGNLTTQVRNIAQVTTAVAKGDLSRKITVEVRGELLELKNTINTMVDQLSSFADEVTRVAREVGTEGKLGGQAEVEGVSGTWKRLTENVNQLAGNLTTQVRAIAEVATAVTKGDLSRAIAVDAPGEVGQLKDNINQMIANLRETTRQNQEQDRLKSNLARIGAMLQGHRDLETVSRLLMSELPPLVGAQYGAFFMAESGMAESGGGEPLYKLLAGYGLPPRKQRPTAFAVGEGLIGQAALERTTILVTDVPPGYIPISSGLGEAVPLNIVALPVLFEEQVLAVIELASFRPFTAVNQAFLEQIVETVGVVLNTIIATMRTEELLEQSQGLAEELQARSRELQRQQEELQRTNAELQEKARQLARQNQAIEVKNAEIELARREVEERAEQLALSSRYKSEFL